ncbi:MAG: Mn-dependent transcriptional regulator [Candidatus Nanosalina sp. J07AB43]|nr:MAG: Mn-dependent transcriptional regulator [Candidatus Nanosalina sp. J07AB43]
MSEKQKYLKAIYNLTSSGEETTTTKQVSENLGVSGASASEAVQKLEDDKLVCRVPYKGFTLSPPGKKLGEELEQKNQKLETMFRKAEVENPEAEAQKVETHISIEAVEKILDKLD